MEMPKSGAGHAKMERLAGRWEGEEKMYPSPWDPQGGVAIGRMSGKLALNGFAMVGDYEQERDGAITFTGHSVMTFDPKTALYSLHWFDCMGSPPELFTGPLVGDRLVVAHGGPGMHARLTYEMGDPRQLRTKMEMSTDGADWKTLFEGRYGRPGQK